MLSKSEKILMSLNSKQKPLCQLTTAELFLNETGKQQKKWQKRVWVWCLGLVVFSLCNHAKPYFLAWWSLTAQAKVPFQDRKELKMNWTVKMFQERLSTLSVRYIKSDKRGQTNCNEFLDNFFMKKAGWSPSNCLLCYVQPYLIRWLQLFISVYQGFFKTF